MQDLNVVGGQLEYRVGRIVITLQWVREGAYSVTGYQGTLRLERYCKSWPTDAEARGWARMCVADARFEQGLPALCGCRGVGWIALDRTWAPCFVCNSHGERIPAAPPVKAG